MKGTFKNTARNTLILRMLMCVCVYIEGVPLATEPGISLIILTPMKILQRNEI